MQHMMTTQPTPHRGMVLMNMTQEQRREAAAKGRATRAAKHEMWRQNAATLKTDFADRGHWQKLATKYGARFPGAHVPGSEFAIIRKEMRRMGLPPALFSAATGGDVKAFHRDNPTWPAFAIIGVALEQRDEMQQRNTNNYTPTEESSR